MQEAASLDIPLADDNSLTLADTIQADFSLEDKMYAEHSKSQLWGIVERYTSDRENSIIKEIFINNRTSSSQRTGHNHRQNTPDKGKRTAAFVDGHGKA